MILLQITSPYYCAGIVVENGKVIRAAPILAWTINKGWSYVKNYFNQKGFLVVKVK